MPSAFYQQITGNSGTVAHYIEMVGTCLCMMFVRPVRVARPVDMAVQSSGPRTKVAKLLVKRMNWGFIVVLRDVLA